MRIALVVHPNRRSAARIATEFVAAARRRDIAVTASPTDCARISGCIERPDDGPADADAVVAVGGDGTVLEAVRLALGADEIGRASCRERV